LTDKFLKVVASDAVAAATDVAAGMKQRGRLLAISLGTGVGAAVLDVDDGQRLGRVLRVNGDSPGHLGQVDVSLTDDPPVGPDGGAGGAEAYLGREALSGKDLGRLTVEDEPVRALVRLLRIGHALYRPDRIALLGGVALGMRHLKEDLQVSTQHQLTGLSRPGWELTFATDTFHAARGAARLAEANQ
jgi:predicted NBD/HSP70 family sugar kinase